MDILVSSNLERLIYRISGDDSEQTAKLMSALSSQGVYKITDGMYTKLSDFYGNYASEEETAEEIAQVYRDCGYVIDTHTAVASKVYRKYREETKDTTPVVIASTASPYKFARSVMQAIDSIRLFPSMFLFFVFHSPKPCILQNNNRNYSFNTILFL